MHGSGAVRFNHLRAMMNLTGKKIANAAAEYLLMALGMCIYSFGWIACILPANTMGGGAAGLAVLLYHTTGLSMGLAVLLINGILLLLGGFIVGWNFGIKTIYCIAMLSLSMSLLEGLLPPGDFFHLDSRLLSVILGAILSGIGVALCFREGGSTGGTDIVAMIINKYRTISYGRILMAVDSIIILSAVFVSDLGIDAVIYGFVMVAVMGYTVDLIQAGNQQSSQIFVFTKHYREMADTIIGTTCHSATIVDATGWFSKANVKIVLVVCRKRETSMMLKMVRRIDPEAFISVGSVMGVYGKGFDALSKI